MAESNKENSGMYNWYRSNIASAIDKILPNSLNTGFNRVYEWYLLSISALTGGAIPFTRDNTYYLEMDTLHKKCIWIATAKSGGEEFKYTIKIDATANTLVINDDVGNEILLDSNVSRIKLKNHDNAMVDLNADVVTISSPKDLNISATDKINISSKTIELTSTISTTVTSPNIDLAGVVNITGSLSLNTKQVATVEYVNSRIAVYH